MPGSTGITFTPTSIPAPLPRATPSPRADGRLGQRAAQGAAGVALHEEAALEREPGRQLFGLRVRLAIHIERVRRQPLPDVPMSVSGVAVGAAERAAHVRVD